MSKLNHEANEFDHEGTLDIEFIEYSLTDDDGNVIGDSEEIDDIEDADDSDDEEKEFNWKKEILSWGIMLVVAVGIAWLISNYVLINAFVPTGSMENTIPKKSRLVGLRLAYTFSEPERGDVIIFKNPNNPEENYVKRIIGLPGETVILENSKVYVYNADASLKVGPLNEPYLKDKYWMGTNERYEFHIPENRSHWSKNSRPSFSGQPTVKYHTVV